MEFFKRKSPEKKEVQKAPTGLLTHIVPILDSGRRNHYALCCGGSVMGDTSGSIDVSPLAACDYLSAQEMAEVEYRDSANPEVIAGKGLVKERILADHTKFQEKVKGVLEEKVTRMAELQKARASPSDLRKEATEYDNRIKKMRDDYFAAQNKYIVRINVGLMTAVYVRGSMLKDAVPPYTPYGKNTLDRIAKSGWRLKKRTQEGKEKR